MSEQAKLVYKDIEIVHNEDSEKWVHTLYGKERSTKSLKSAKETIDKPPPKDKSEIFEPFDAYYKEYAGEFRTVTVTSVAESPDWRMKDGQTEVWVKMLGDRRKVFLHHLYRISRRNNELVAEAKEHTRLWREQEALSIAAYGKMTKVTLTETQQSEEEVSA